MINLPFLVKGALVYYSGPMLVPVPNVIVFQYNPDSMTRSFTPWTAPPRVVDPQFEKDGKTLRNESELRAYGEQLAKVAQPYDPAETFTLTLELDAADLLEHPERNPTAVAVGVADRLAAIELLLYPPGDPVSGGLLGSTAQSLGSDSGVAQKEVADLRANLKSRDAPVVLFFWGPGRIVPVRIQSMTIEEEQYSASLFPVRAKVSLGLRVLDLDDLGQMSGDPAEKGKTTIASACYSYTLAQKRGLAVANLANGLASVAGMLPI